MKKFLIKYLLEYRHLSMEDQKLIADAFKLRKIKTGQILIKAQKVAKELIFINKGILKITVPHPANRDIVYYFLKEHQLMTFLYSMYGNIPAEQGLEAASDGEILYISYHDLDQLYLILPYLRALIDKIAQLSMAEMVTLRNQYLAGEALAKYRLFLTKQPEVAHRVTLVDIASYLGITPQSLSRIRREFVKS
jgi:CRP/FNR family transcriptional regulator, anaerobic regulatory protein